MAARRIVKAVLVDLSGTLHIEDTAIPGAQAALKRLRNAPVVIRFVTNTTKECKRSLLERLRKLSFDLNEDEIFTSLTAARNLVEQRNARPMLLVDDGALHDFEGIVTHNPNAVVIGLAPEHFNYQTMNKAFSCSLTSHTPPGGRRTSPATCQHPPNSSSSTCHHCDPHFRRQHVRAIQPLPLQLFFGQVHRRLPQPSRPPHYLPRLAPACTHPALPLPTGAQESPTALCTVPPHCLPHLAGARCFLHWYSSARSKDLWR
ncbi:haloacid dehalogenase-like hydrolase domain-containing protein 2 isoform X2 [Ascaphus truei]|uniref:haloacid dehalogenase-like hydrolase domain-containing protein 2 isoform X2 n=1 Tax=Ascaphus truei TaxID=8439 RepID=UPI003F5A9EE2